MRVNKTATLLFVVFLIPAPVAGAQQESAGLQDPPWLKGQLPKHVVYAVPGMDRVKSRLNLTYKRAGDTELKADVYSPPDSAAGSVHPARHTYSRWLSAQESADPTYGKIAPILIARAGLDNPVLNGGVDRFVQEALSKNASLDLCNHPTGHHGFDILDDNDRSREIIKRTIEFIRTHGEPGQKR